MARQGLLARLVGDKELHEVMKTMNKPVGSMEYDPWGFNKSANETAVALFRETFDFQPQYNLREIFAHYRETK